jgi:hypothetical protein
MGRVTIRHPERTCPTIISSMGPSLPIFFLAAGRADHASWRGGPVAKE